MQSRLLSAIALAALALGPVGSGCATQQDNEMPRSGSTSGTAGQSGGGTASAGSDAKGGTSGTGSGIAGSASGGKAGSSAAGSAMGGEPSEPLAGAGGVNGDDSGGAGGEASGCLPDCDDGDPCTTDTCLLGHCSHTASTAPCEDDDDPCTTDVCQAGSCQHPDNGTCECKTQADCDDDEECTNDDCVNHECTKVNRTGACTDDGSPCTSEACAGGSCVSSDNQTCECMTGADCNDQDPCTFNQCNGSHDCVYPDNGSCPVGTPFVVNNFNSSPDWVANLTTPGGRALVDVGFTNTNLEGTTNVYLAATAEASLEMSLASLVGLAKLSIAIRCVQAGSEGMVHVGVWNGTAWTEKVLSVYGAVPTADYATLDVPLVDFGVPLGQITKMRLRFVPTGGIKEWRLNDVSAAE